MQCKLKIGFSSFKLRARDEVDALKSFPVLNGKNFWYKEPSFYEN